MVLDYSDGAEVLHALLNGSQWTESNHAGSKPNIRIIYNTGKVISISQKNFIGIYELAHTYDYDYSARLRHDETIPYALDVRAKTRRQLKTLCNEAIRVLEVNQATIGDVVVGEGLSNGFNRVWATSRNDMSDRKSNFHREVIDLELEMIGVVRSTS